MSLPAGRLFLDLPEELRDEFLVGDVARTGVNQGVLEAVASVLGQFAKTRLAEVLELLAVALPAVAVLVVLTGVHTLDGLPASDAGHRLVLGSQHRRQISAAPHLAIGSVLVEPERTFYASRRRSTRMEVSSRHHLRSDDVREIADALDEGLGVDLDAESFELVELSDEDFDVVLVDGDPLIWYPEGEPFVTVRGANEFPPSTGVVTVDAGAISFVSDGADIMRPGITDANSAIEEGDLIVVEEEQHGKALAVGRALTSGDDMVGNSGKVVENLHHVGDELYEFSV